MEKIFNESNQRLIKVFLEEEAKQYGPKTIKDFLKLYEEYGREIPYEKFELNGYGIYWVNRVFESIMKELEEKANQGADKFIFSSHGNTGCLVSQLVLDGTGRYFNWKKGVVTISLCTCGNLNCWGEVVLPENYKEK